MEFRILGPLEVADDGRVLALGSGRQLALVAVLLAPPKRGGLDRSARRRAVGRRRHRRRHRRSSATTSRLLRKELGDRLETRPPGYALRVEEGELDSEHLERAVDGGQLDALTDALALWRGTPLSQFAYEPFAQAEVTHCRGARLAAIESRVDAELALGRRAQLIPELEALVQRHPSRERHPRAADACAVPLRSTGGRARGLSARATLAPRRARRRAGRELRDLERGILNQDASLAAPRTPVEDPPRRLQRRWTLLVAAGAVLAAVAAGLVVAMRESRGGLSTVPPNHVGVIDPSLGEVVAAVPVGIRPGPITSASARSGSGTSTIGA